MVEGSPQGNADSLLGKLRAYVSKAVSYAPVRAVLAIGCLWLLTTKAGSISHDIDALLPPPPPPLPLGPRVDAVDVLPKVLIIVVAGVYLAWHFRPGSVNPMGHFWPIIICLGLSLSAWAIYYLVLPAWLTCDYAGEKYIIGLYYTEHGREYAKTHTCDELIRHHPGALGKLMTPWAITWSRSVFTGAYISVFLLFSITIILLMEIVLIIFLPRHKEDQTPHT